MSQKSLLMPWLDFWEPCFRHESDFFVIIRYMQKQIILASTSPRRKQLLSLLAISFKAVESGFQEKIHQRIPPQKLVKQLALGKAKAAAKKYRNAIIIGADTIVVHNGKAMGKPKSKAEAEKMLKSFSGKDQFIFSALAITDGKKVFVALDKVKITFRKLSHPEIAAYINTGEPMDRAGSYALQDLGFNLVAALQGDLSTAMGMPMTLVYNGLKEFGVKI